MNRRFVLGALGVGLLGLVLCAIGLAVDTRQTLFSWLMAWAFATSLALGALILVMIMNAANGEWFLLFRRLGEAMAGSLVPLAILGVPLLLGLAQLYPWAGALPDDPHARHALAHKRLYLNEAFFIIRYAVYFVLFIMTVLVLRGWSLRQDSDGDIALRTRQRMWSSALLPAIALALTFGATDWLMSLSATWFSTVYGIYYWAGGFVAAISLLVIVARRAGVPGIRVTHFYALGRLMLAFTIFWTYIAYAQGFIIWIGNKPDEVTWYVTRTRGSWAAVAIVLFAAHFAIPFFILLLRSIKYRPRALALVAGWMVFAHLVDIYWIVLPALHSEGFAPHWLDVAALVAVVGLCAAWSGAWLRGHKLVPEAAPAMALGLAYDAGLTAGGDDAAEAVRP
jgi:hypothetical protein